MSLDVTRMRSGSNELVDGERLVAMLEGLEVGLSPVKAYRIDAEFFREFQT